MLEFCVINYDVKILCNFENFNFIISLKINLKFMNKPLENHIKQNIKFQNGPHNFIAQKNFYISFKTLSPRISRPCLSTLRVVLKRSNR